MNPSKSMAVALTLKLTTCLFSLMALMAFDIFSLLWSNRHGELSHFFYILLESPETVNWVFRFYAIRLKKIIQRPRGINCFQNEKQIYIGKPWTSFRLWSIFEYHVFLKLNMRFDAPTTFFTNTSSIAMGTCIYAVLYNSSGAVKATLLMAKIKVFSPAHITAHERAKELLPHAFNHLGRNSLVKFNLLDQVQSQMPTDSEI